EQIRQAAFEHSEIEGAPQYRLIDGNARTIGQVLREQDIRDWTAVDIRSGREDSSCNRRWIRARHLAYRAGSELPTGKSHSLQHGIASLATKRLLAAAIVQFSRVDAFEAQLNAAIGRRQMDQVGSAQMAILSGIVRGEADGVAVGLIANNEEFAGNDQVGRKKRSGTGNPCCSGHCDHPPHAQLLAANGAAGAMGRAIMRINNITSWINYNQRSSNILPTASIMNSYNVEAQHACELGGLFDEKHSRTDQHPFQDTHLSPLVFAN